MNSEINPNNVNLSNSERYFIYISLGYCNSQVIPSFLTDYKPIMICGELPNNAPNNFIYIPPKESRIYPNPIRVPMGNYLDLYSTIINSDDINSLFNEIIQNQGKLPVKCFSNHKSAAPIFDNENIECFGLSPEQATQLNDKTWQYKFLRSLPLPKHKILKVKDAAELFEELRSERGIFISQAYGGGGYNSFIAKDKSKMIDYLNQLPKGENIIIAECLDLIASPSIELIIANEEEVISYGLVDQLFDPNNPLGCRGSTYPSKLNGNIQSQIIELSQIIGRKLASEGIRGSLGIDFNVNSKGDVFFGEINARYTGNTSERMLLMEQNRPQSHPTMMELERLAIKYGSFKGYQKWATQEDISFLKMEVHALQDGIVTEELHLPRDERIVFSERSSSIIGSLEKGAQFKAGSSLGKIIVVSSDSKELTEKQHYLERIINKSIAYH